MKSERFVILGMQRSGTTITHISLGGHPDVSTALDEVFVDPFFTRGLAAFTGGKQDYQERREGYRQLFDLICGVWRRERLAAGFKVAIGNATEAIDVVNCLREYFPGIKVILVQRSDLAAQFGSLHRAVLSGVWHAWGGNGSRNGPRVEQPLAEFKRYALEAAAAVAQLRTLDETHEVLEFNYENDICPGHRWPELFDFLGVPRLPITWINMGKVAPPPADYIANYEAMRKVQDKIVPPTRSEARQAAARRMEELAQGESPLFLGHRACSYLDQGRLEEAFRDFLIAFQKRSKGGVDFPLLGHLCGRFEGLEGPPEVGQAVAWMKQECGLSHAFRFSRANVLLRRKRPAGIPEEMIGLLLSDGELVAAEERGAFDLLLRSLTALEDLGGAQEAIQVLESRYGGHEGFQPLKALVAGHS